MNRPGDLATSTGEVGANSAPQSEQRGTSPPKRKADGGDQSPAPRAKRNRYISIACNECKRRKIKCNGQTPCQRCGNLSLECLYAPNCCNLKDSEEFQSMKQHLASLQEQVDSLYANLHSLRQYQSHEISHDSNSPVVDPSLYATGPSSDGPRPVSMQRSLLHGGGGPKMPRYRGPSSSAFNLDVAKTGFQTMGIAHPESGLDEAGLEHQYPTTSTPVSMDGPFHAVHPEKDPVWMLKKEDALQMCRTYDEEVGLMYPIIELDELLELTNMLFTFMEAAARTGLTQRMFPGADAISNDEANLLKMVFAITLSAESGGQNALSKRLFDCVKPFIDRKQWEAADVKGVKLLVTTAMYLFHMDDDIHAWRYLGIAMRHALELGFHRRDALRKAFPGEAEYLKAVKFFWSLYTMDRRFCFGTGLPFTIQDADIDPAMPDPDHTTPYLKCMVSYFRLGSRVWYSGLGFAGNMDLKRDEIGYLDYQVLQWHRDIPPFLQFRPDDPSQESSKVSRGLRRLRVLIHVRFLHMRILIHRPVLHSAATNHENQASASTAVELAKETIRTLARLNAVSDIYRNQQVCFNHFLVSALAVLMLAVSQDANTYNRVVREELFMALELIKGFSTKSYVSKRLWEMIRGLREVAEKLGLLSRGPAAQAQNGHENTIRDAHSNAAVAMAGLAGHSMDELSVYSSNMQSGNGGTATATPGAELNGGTMASLGSSPLDGIQMSNELTHLFEAVGGYGPDGSAFSGTDGEFMANLGYEEEFSRVMRDLL